MLFQAAMDIVRGRARYPTSALLFIPAFACGGPGASGSPNDGGLDSGAGAVAREGGQASETDVSVPDFCADAAPTQSCIAADIHASNYDQTCKCSLRLGEVWENGSGHAEARPAPGP